MINSTITQKKKYEKIKHKYFESCQLAEKQEKKLLEEMNRTGSTNESINSQNEILTKLRIDSQMEYQQYKNEHKITNDLYNENNKKYFESCQLAEKQEKKLLEEMNRYGHTDESVHSQNEILTQMRVDSQIEYQKYKNELKITNDL